MPRPRPPLMTATLTPKEEVELFNDLIRYAHWITTTYQPGQVLSKATWAQAHELTERAMPGWLTGKRGE